MRDPISKMCREIQPSGIRKFFDVVSEMPDAISLGVGEPDFDTPWHIREEGIYSLEHGRTYYTSNAGLKELKEEICRYLRRKFNLSYKESQVLVTIGGSEAIDIRQRAKNSVAKHIQYAADQCEIALYPDTYFKDKETARKCLQWERRLELAMENGRYFDLRRWGIASKTLNAYFETEKNDVYDGQTYAQYLRDAHYTPGKNEFYPVPYNQLYYVPGLYSQNKGY